MGVAYRTGAVRVRSSPREPALRMLVSATTILRRTGVLAFDSLEQRRYVRRTQGELTITRAGKKFLGELGIDLEALATQRRRLSHACLDWSVRRHHLAGAVGAALLQRSYEVGWARRVKNARVVAFSPAGERAFRQLFHTTKATAWHRKLERDRQPAGRLAL